MLDQCPVFEERIYRGSWCPKGVEQKDLEGKVLPVLEKIGCKIDPDNIENCHQLSKKSDNVIKKFSR